MLGESQWADNNSAGGASGDIDIDVNGGILMTSSTRNAVVARKRRYQRLMPWQKQLLAKHFISGDFWPSRETREALAQQLGIDQRKVQIWFQNERAKCSISIRTPQGEVQVVRTVPSSSAGGGGGAIGRTASPSSEYSGDEQAGEEELKEEVHYGTTELILPPPTAAHAAQAHSFYLNYNHSGSAVSVSDQYRHPIIAPQPMTQMRSGMMFKSESAPDIYGQLIASDNYSASSATTGNGGSASLRFESSENSAFRRYSRSDHGAGLPRASSFLSLSQQGDDADGDDDSMDVDQDSHHHAAAAASLAAVAASGQSGSSWGRGTNESAAAAFNILYGDNDSSAAAAHQYSTSSETAVHDMSSIADGVVYLSSEYLADPSVQATTSVSAYDHVWS
eukprot:TRINITY_DN3059_c0_g1_i1.p1 TRINITY_DN3059_c0_g1~~TRINITY_DN3059_c0_g1_i1.p1  ORF type:complete len:392 (+),score=72.11 TRINITY_DN3059_c0_g1_i1:135-1310(+)